MRGLIYKDTKIFLNSIDKRSAPIVPVVIVLLFFTAGVYAGLFSSSMLAMAVGMQNIMCFSVDEQVKWRKYELAMPLRSFDIVASKYISVVYTIGISLIGSLIFNALSSVLFKNFDILIWGLSVGAAIIIPLIWTGICLPLTYWFGFRSAQTMGLFFVIPVFFFIKYFEDGPGMAAMGDYVSSYVALFAGLAIAIFGLSFVVSVIGYGRKK